MGVSPYWIKGVVLDREVGGLEGDVYGPEDGLWKDGTHGFILQ